MCVVAFATKICSQHATSCVYNAFVRNDKQVAVIGASKMMQGSDSNSTRHMLLGSGSTVMLRPYATTRVRPTPISTVKTATSAIDNARLKLMMQKNSLFSRADGVGAKVYPSQLAVSVARHGSLQSCYFH
jgi:hypothetical protein